MAAFPGYEASAAVAPLTGSLTFTLAFALWSILGIFEDGSVVGDVVAAAAPPPIWAKKDGSEESSVLSNLATGDKAALGGATIGSSSNFLLS